MKKINQFSWAAPLMLLALTTILFAFSPMPGAHSVRIYLDDKLVVDQYVNFKGEAPKLQLNASENYTQLIVRYSECGRPVTGRKLSLKDDQGKLLKQWSFVGSSTGFQGSMACPLKEITALKGTKLYYSSDQFSEGHQIVSIASETGNKTALK